MEPLEPMCQDIAQLPNSPKLPNGPELPNCPTATEPGILHCHCSYSTWLADFVFQFDKVPVFSRKVLAWTVGRDKKVLQDGQGRDSSSKKQKTSLKTSVNSQKKSKSNDLENLTSDERIAVLQTKMQEIRKRYLLLKAEVAAIDRRKRLKKKQQERAAAMSSSSPDGMLGECRFVCLYKEVMIATYKVNIAISTFPDNILVFCKMSSV
ncbi:hypothetical protein BTVI_147021 [Pitangus sulphuratus]|nr:hypothetical protein BTVI_147021 [Pitangus sulphuratus]